MVRQRQKENEKDEYREYQELAEENRDDTFSANNDLCKIDENKTSISLLSQVCHKALLQYVSNQGYPLCEKLTANNIMVFIHEIV